jgi:hypothetical protein
MRLDPGRRHALERIGAAFRQAAPAAMRLVPRTDLVNVLEFEEQAKRALEPAAFARIAGGDRSAFDRLTLQPRVMIPTRGLDLGLTLFGHAHHSPIIVGPIDGGSFSDPGADALLLRGASAANATVVAAGATATRAEVRQMKTPVWCQVFATDAAAGDSIKRAVDAGCRVACVTVGAEPTARGVRAAAVDARQWRAVQATVTAAGVPVVVKGITSVAAARQAVQNGARGIVGKNRSPETEDAAENLSALLCYTAHFVAATEVVLRQPMAEATRARVVHDPEPLAVVLQLDEVIAAAQAAELLLAAPGARALRHLPVVVHRDAVALRGAAPHTQRLGAAAQHLQEAFWPDALALRPGAQTHTLHHAARECPQLLRVGGTTWHVRA